jgi:hypothetical protein
MPKGYAPSIFVSSTCFDLNQVRADIREFIKSLGLDPILSDYSSFPVDPNNDAIKNCLDTVKARADIFLLIVGARYGQTPRNGKSVTNLEYMEARAKGIPIYVFVNRAILNILEVWKRNPEGNYEGIVDSTALFAFVDSLKQKAEHWVFGFESAQDITGTLKTQLSYLFMDALDFRSRIRTAGIPTDLQSLAARPLEILLQKPLGWEYLLFAEVFRDGIRSLQDRRYDYDYGFNLGPVIQFSAPNELFNWLSTHVMWMPRIVQALQKLLNEALPAAFGAPGVAGDALHIAYVAKRSIKTYETAIEWALEFKRLHAPDEFHRLMDITSGLTKNIIQEISDFAERAHEKINSGVSKAATEGGKTDMVLTLNMTTPDMTEFDTEMNRLRKRYNLEMQGM